jgi:hypothetical protein
MIISNNAKLYCMLVGFGLSAVFAFVEPVPNFEEKVLYGRDFNAELDAKWRDETRDHVTYALTNAGDPCNVEDRKTMWRAVDGYYASRANSTALAERYLAPLKTEEVVRKWNGLEDKKIEDAILLAARKGFYTRDDFRPTTYPELATVLDRVPPVELVCASKTGPA